MSSEPRALEAVYRSSWLALTRLAYLLVGDRTEAEDIVQGVFASATPRWDAIDNPVAYLRRAVVNRANDMHRRAYRDAATTVHATESIDEPVVDELWNLVQQLPAPQRAVVVLRFYEDLPIADIATQIGRPENTVRSDLRRALMKLKGLLP